MSSVLDRKVLVLNKHWRACAFTNVRNALHRMMKPKRDDKYVIGLLYQDDGNYVPMEWEDWLELPIKDGDPFIRTPKRNILAPSIIITQRLTKIPEINPRMTKLGLWNRQKNKDMYTGEPLSWGSCNIDHYIPRAKGGPTSWENCGLTKIAINQKKGDKLAHEVGLSLATSLTAPPPRLLSFQLVKKENARPEWEPFLKEIK